MNEQLLEAPAPTVRGPLRGIYAGNTRSVVARGLQVIARNNWLIVVTGARSCRPSGPASRR